MDLSIGEPSQPSKPPGIGGAVGAPPPSRIAWIDFARGVAIILVVYGHCFRGLREAGFIASDSVLSTVDYVIYGFHMPLFFFLSGAVSEKAFTLPPIAFVRSRAVAIAWPYFLWMTVELALLQGFSGLTNMRHVPVGFATYAYAPLSPFWFLYALFVANVVLFACRSLTRARLFALAAVVFVAGQVGALNIVQLTAWGLLYFCLGLCLADWVRRPGFVHAIARPSRLVGLLGVTVLGSLILMQFDVGYRYEVPVAAAGSAMIFGLAENIARAADRWRAFRVISFLGRMSLTVLVVHVLGTAGTRILLQRALHVNLASVHLILGTAGGLAAPLLLQMLGAWLGVLRPLGLPVVEPMAGALPWWPRRKSPVIPAAEEAGEPASPTRQSLAGQ